MSYTIALRVYQTNPARGFFHVVEQTVWRNGVWSQMDGMLVLSLHSNGPSGVVRFLSTKGERIALAVGVHNYQRWCDIVTNLNPDETALKVNCEYYNDGFRSFAREKQSVEHSATSNAGTKVQIKYTVAEGHKLEADVIFG